MPHQLIIFHEGKYALSLHRIKDVVVHFATSELPYSISDKCISVANLQCAGLDNKQMLLIIYWRAIHLPSELLSFCICFLNLTHMEVLIPSVCFIYF